MLRKSVTSAAVAVGLLAFLSGCGGDAPASGPISTTVLPSDSRGVKEAKVAWVTCVTCHGSTGQGDGVAAAGFPVKPKSFNDSAWQDSVDDDYIKKIISEGAAAVGKNALMTGAPHLNGNDEALSYLVKIVRSFGK